jgi:hypothetical protein
MYQGSPPSQLTILTTRRFLVPWDSMMCDNIEEGGIDANSWFNGGTNPRGGNKKAADGRPKNTSPYHPLHAAMTRSMESINSWKL